jgi:UDP-2,3-diacylglucosamine pyrophosphatase LpxH
MLVIISDLHLTDGTSGETIRPGAFRAFRESLRELAYDASWRSDKRYVPIDGIDLVLLGDILDVIRSTRWCGAPAQVRPWGDQNDPRFSDLVSRIAEGVIQNNQESLSILKSLHNPEIMSFPTTSEDGGVEVKPLHRVPVPVRIHYLVGNHDWFFHLKGPAHDAIRKMIVDAIGLENSPNHPFPHEPFESQAIESIYRDHRVFARHGDIFDPTNYEHSRDASSLGDAIVVELLDKFGVVVRERLGDRLPDSCDVGLKEIDNVRPLSIIPIWVDGLLLNTCTPVVAEEVKGIWNELVDEFLGLDFLKARPFGSSLLIKLGFKISRELPMSGLSDVAAWFSSKFGGGRGESFYPYAMNEKSFIDGWAKFIVYGHTHHYEIVPLQSLQQGNAVTNQMYINSGTWRPVHELARFHPGQKHFVGYHVMTYLSFFKGDERKGKAFESWTGALESSL